MTNRVVLIRKIKFIFSRKFLPALLSISAGLALNAITRSRRLMVFALNRRKRPYEVKSELLTYFSEKLSRKLRIAVVRFDGLGDNALTLPLLDALHEDERVSEVISIVPEKIAFALSGFYSGKIFPVQPFSIHYPRLGKTIVSSLVTYSFLGAFLSWRQGLRVKKLLGEIDLVVLPRWDHDLDLNTRFFARGLGKFVVGHNPKWIENNHRELSDIALLDYVCDSPDMSAHEFEHHQDLAKYLGFEIQKYKRGIAPKDVAVNSIVFVQIGAALPKRVWDLKNWLQILPTIAMQNPSWSFIINSSSNGDFENLLLDLPAPIRPAFSELLPEQRGSLYEALLSSSLYLGSDTGPLHLAEYLNIRSIVVSCHPKTGKRSHVNSPARFGNLVDSSRWVSPKNGIDDCVDGCQSNTPHCINQVSPEEVLDTLSELIAKLRS